ncbi:MAG: hypothetical protein QOJ07_184 [Thermoleophilaceae bacterium]|nr:hypothetical protein [Thermoleophilaceae bacterium]
MMKRPDPERLGGIGWARRTRGALTRRERRRLLAAIARTQADYLAGRLKLATGRVPRQMPPELEDEYLLAPPDSVFARAAEAACAEQSAVVAGHSYRTWAFGRALAALDRADVDPELFYAAALLHDHGIESTVTGEDFTLRSADRALACARETNTPPERAELVADAIVVHATPGAEPGRDGTGAWVQAGAMADLVGARLWDLPRAAAVRIDRAHPAAPDAASQVIALIKREVRAQPDGRFALNARCGLTTAIRLAPRPAP